MPHRRASALPPQCHFTTAVPKYISGRTSYLQVRLEFHRLPQVIPTFCNRSGFGPPRTYSARFTLLMVRSPGFGSPACDSFALSDSLSLRLHLYSGLTSPHTTTRWLILQKARRHPSKEAPTGRKHMVSGSVSLPFTGFFSPFPHGTGALSVACSI